MHNLRLWRSKYKRFEIIEVFQIKKSYSKAFKIELCLKIVNL